jgi:hypothetical protein
MNSISIKLVKKLDAVVHACKPSIWKVEAGELRVHGQPELHSKFQANLGYIMRPYLKKKAVKN